MNLCTNVSTYQNLLEIVHNGFRSLRHSCDNVGLTVHHRGFDTSDFGSKLLGCFFGRGDILSHQKGLLVCASGEAEANITRSQCKAALSSSFGAFRAALAVRSMALSSNYSRTYNNQLTPRNTNGSSLTSSRLAWLRATCSLVTALSVLRFASAVTWLDKMSVAAFSCAIEYFVLLWLRPTDTFDLGFANWQVQNVF